MCKTGPLPTTNIMITMITITVIITTTTTIIIIWDKKWLIIPVVIGALDLIFFLKVVVIDSLLLQKVVFAIVDLLSKEYILIKICYLGYSEQRQSG